MFRFILFCLLLLQGMPGSAQAPADRIAQVKVGDKYGYIRPDGSFALPAEFEDGDTWAGTFFDVKRDSTWMCVNRSGKVIWDKPLPFRNSYGQSFNEGLRPVCFWEHLESTNERWYVSLTGWWGYIDTSGKVVIPVQFTCAYKWSEGLGPVRTDSLMGYINREGEFEIEPRFEEAKCFSEGCAAVRSNGKWGLIDRKGNWIVEPEWDWINDMKEGRCWVRKDEKYRLMNDRGKLIGKEKFDVVEDFSGGFAIVNIGGEVSLPEDLLMDFSMTLATGKYGLINREGKMVIPFQEYRFNHFSDGKIIFNDPKAGFFENAGVMNTDGKIILAPHHGRSIKGVYGGLAPASEGGKWGYINIQGEWVIPPQFDGAESFR